MEWSYETCSGVDYLAGSIQTFDYQNGAHAIVEARRIDNP
jgi:hypothetical protein